MLEELIVARGAKDSFDDLLHSAFPAHKILVLCGQNYSRNLAQEIFQDRLALWVVDSNSIDEERKIHNEWLEKGIDCVVSVGGGRVANVSANVLPW